MAYGLVWSEDEITWHVAKEGVVNRQDVVRERSQDIYREAEFWSKKHKFVKIRFDIKPHRA